MCHHPMISSISGIIANIVVLSTIILISTTRFIVPEVEMSEDVYVKSKKTAAEDEKKEIIKVHETAKDFRKTHVENIK